MSTLEKMVGFKHDLDIVVLNKLLATLQKRIDDITANGATGTFTTTDLKTVTVTNGIITSIV